MRVPNREHRYFLAPSPQFGRRERRDERIPRISTPAAEEIRKRDRAAHYHAARQADDRAPEITAAGPLPGPAGFGFSKRFSDLLHEASWERILRKHGLVGDD